MIVDVVIAGGGPNGLMLACELCLAGIRPVVLERLPRREAENRANGLAGQVVRMLDRRGLYARLSGDAAPPRPVQRYMFAAMPLELGALHDNPLHILPVPQRQVERVLEERAVELGAEIRRGHELTGLSQTTDAVTAHVSGPTGAYRLEARYLVGADGGHSLTRRVSGIEFPGVTRDNTVSRTAHVRVPVNLIDPATGGLRLPGYGFIPPLMHHRTERGLFTYGVLPSRPAMLHTTEWVESAPDDQQPMTLDELRESVRRVLGVDLPIEPPEGEGPHLLRRLNGGNSRIASRFRAGRVLLVGDAAHVHSGIGGPGLNLGLQDAVNLGWKLAAEVRGWAPPALLDSYEAERRPVAERVVMHTQAQAALIAPGSEVTALRELFTELLDEPRNRQHIADMMAGADIRYDMATDRDHPLVGRWAPDLAVEADHGRVRLAELTPDGRPLLLDMTDGASLADELSAWRERVRTVTARPVAGDVPATALLLRPDCYVAWASSSPSPGGDECKALEAAVAHWFGSAPAA